MRIQHEQGRPLNPDKVISFMLHMANYFEYKITGRNVGEIVAADPAGQSKSTCATSAQDRLGLQSSQTNTRWSSKLPCLWR